MGIDLLITNFLLAETGAERILRSGINTSQSIADAWNTQWLEVFQSPLYGAIVRIGVFFAVFTLLFFIIQFARRLILDDDLSSALPSLLFPVLVLLLLANNGRVLASTTLGLKDMVHELSGQVLEITILDVSIQETIQAAAAMGAVTGEISAQVSQCQGMVGEKQIACFEAANKQVQESLGAYQARYRALPSILRDNVQALQEGIRAAGNENNPITGAAFGVASYMAGLLNAPIVAIIQTVLFAFQWAFANILEIALLLTGLMGPIAVASALLFDGKPLFAWLTGFFSLGMAQLCYNIICGLAAVVVINAEVSDTLGFLVIVALLAPALALALAAGGGMAIFSVMASGSTALVATVARTTVVAFDPRH